MSNGFFMINTLRATNEVSRLVINLELIPRHVEDCYSPEMQSSCRATTLSTWIDLLEADLGSSSLF
jgi:hypothetical protein